MGFGIGIGKLTPSETAVPTVCVVGGGITGLAAAWELATAERSRARVVLLESDSRLGGKLRTTDFGGRPVDLGPDAFLARREEALNLCRELGLGPDLVAPGANRSYVWVRGRLRRLPSGLALGVPTRFVPLARSGICSPRGLTRAALDLSIPFSSRRRSGSPGEEHHQEGLDALVDQSVGSVVRRRLGNEINDRLADPLIGGIHAGGVDTTSAAAVFPQLLEAETRPGSLMRALRAAPRDGPVFMTLRGGMGRLTERLRAALVERGVDIRQGAAAESLDIDSSSTSWRRWSIGIPGGRVACDGVVVCIPAPDASRFVRRVDGVLAEMLGSIRYASVTLVTIRMPRSAFTRALEGTGFLVPVAEGRLLTACTWLSSKWPELEREEDVLLRASMGRYGDARADELTDDEVVSRALEELGEMLGFVAKPLEALVTRWPGSFPQYFVGHRRRVQQIEAAAASHRGLVLAGAALHGIGIPACVGSGRGAAVRLLGELETSPRVAG